MAVSRIYTAADGLANDFVRALSGDHAGNLWVGTRGGLTRLRGWCLLRLTPRPMDSPTILSARYSMMPWKSMGCGTLRRPEPIHQRRVLHFDYQRWTLERCRHLAPMKMLTAPLWIGTNGGGLDRLRDGRIVTYTTRQGLLDDVVYQVLSDGGHNLWLSCRRRHLPNQPGRSLISLPLGLPPRLHRLPMAPLTV